MFGLLSKFQKKKPAGPENAPEIVAPFVPAPVLPSLRGAAVNAAPEFIELGLPEVLQAMWGAGYSMPTSRDLILGLVSPLQMDSQKTMLDLNAGLGGAARLIALQFKTYVTGFERNADLAQRGMKISSDQGQGKHAAVQAGDPVTMEYTKRADAVIAREFMFSVEDKDAMLKKIFGWLKERGQIVMTDFVCEADVLEKPAVKAWLSREPYGAFPVANKDVSGLFASNGYDLRVQEDITKAYRRDGLMGLAKLVRWLEGKKNLSSRSKKLVGEVVELWALRLGALDAGVKNMRYYAIKTS